MSEFQPTHEIESYGPVQLIDEGTDDGSSGAYTAAEFAESRWPRVRRMADGRWFDGTDSEPEDITYRVREKRG